ncbi:hypothetical protein ABZY14_10865 [Streptomyces sp. NPDC006617]|uniref:hypothetical protein n=1 Tax=Streptomyces sp. NPDC006617 TaxID=3155354 RepID=UPI0033A18D5E
MSHHLSLYRFLDGEPAEPDLDVVRAVLSPVRAGQEKDDAATEYWIRAADGSEVEIGVFAEHISVIRPQVGDVWKIIIELVDQLRAGILIPHGTFLCPDCVRTFPRAWRAVPFSCRWSLSPPSSGRPAPSWSR